MTGVVEQAPAADRRGPADSVREKVTTSGAPGFSTRPTSRMTSRRPGQMLDRDAQRGTVELAGGKR